MKKMIQWLCGFCLLAGLLSGCHTKFIQDQEEIYAPEDPELFSTAGIDAQGYRLDAQTEHRVQSQILRSSKSFTISFWFKPEAKGFLSLFSLGEKASGVTIRNLKYEMQDGEITNSFPIGISNEFIGKRSSVTVEQGMLAVILSEKE